MAPPGPRSLTLVIPVHDEAAVLGPSLQCAWDWLAALPRPTELLVVDDGSTDATPARLAAFAASRPADGPKLTVVRHAANRGKGFSVRRGFVLARGELVVFTDADLTYPLHNVATVVHALEEGADLVYGNRMHPDSRYVVAPPFFGALLRRHLIGRVFNVLVRTLVVPGVRDSQAGLKGAHKDAAVLLAGRTRLRRFSFDVELLFAARRAGLRITDCPVELTYRKEPSAVRLARDAAAMLRDVVRIRWRGWRGAYDREPSAAELQRLATGDETASIAGVPGGDDSERLLERSG